MTILVFHILKPAFYWFTLGVFDTYQGVPCESEEMQEGLRLDMYTSHINR